MTNYNTTISTSPTDFNGNATSSIVSGQFNDKQHFSSEDFVDNGVVVRDRNGDKKSVYTSNDLAPDDIVTVGGIPMTVAQAKSVGFSLDGSEPIEDGTSEIIADDTDDTPQLDLRREGDGQATDAELVALDNVASAVKLHTGMDLAATLELGKDVLTGQAPEQTFVALQARGISKDAVHGSINQVVSIGQDAARRELGDAGYRELSALADNSAAIKGVVIDHGIKRMTGKAAKGMTWKHVLSLARQCARA